MNHSAGGMGLFSNCRVHRWVFMTAAAASAPSAIYDEVDVKSRTGKEAQIGVLVCKQHNKHWR